jgi:hypothetical protein
MGDGGSTSMQPEWTKAQPLSQSTISKQAGDVFTSSAQTSIIRGVRASSQIDSNLFIQIQQTPKKTNEMGICANRH